MSIAGGLFNTNNKKDDVGDTKSTADGDASPTQAPEVDLTTSIPGFEDDADEGLLIETGGEFGDVEGVDPDPTGNEDVEAVPESAQGPGGFDDDADAAEQGRLDPES